MAGWKQTRFNEPTVYELSRKGRIGVNIVQAEKEPGLPDKIKAEAGPALPEMSEVDVVRHYLRLSEMNYGIDTGIYPLGSCTMKYNPKICEQVARWDVFSMLHPYQHPSTAQGALQVMFELQNMLAALAGVDAVTLQPSAGAHGEFLGMLIVRRYFKDKGEDRDEVIVPDTAHGTNPASAAMAGYKVIVVPSNEEGMVDLDALREAVGPRTASIMLTNPNTLGIFETHVMEIAKVMHEAGSLLYYDGANLNAVMGYARPGDMGFDIVHFNLHKTFSTPHGGGGPGSGPIGVKEKLADYLPVPMVSKGEKADYFLNFDIPKTVGKIKNFYGNFAVLLKAFVYMKIMGANGLKKAAEISVLNSNYLKQRILDLSGEKGYSLPYTKLRKHEFVLSGKEIKMNTGVMTKDVAKRLLDMGFHAPTVYFPLIVEEALMIEPTESEDRETLDAYAEAMARIKEEAYSDPQKVTSAPSNTSVAKVDDVKAARRPVLTWKMYLERKEKE